MAIKDVTNLRREGRLKEAYDLAKKELQDNPNEWTRMSLFWVLRDIVSNLYVPAQNIEKARVCLKQMKMLLPNMLDDNGAGERAYLYLYKLILPNAKEVEFALNLSKTNPNEAYQKIIGLFGRNTNQLDHTLHEDYGWIIYRYMKANYNLLTSVQIRGLLRDYMLLQNERPSLIHSMILNFALNFSKEHDDFSFYRFFIIWGPEYLRGEDYDEGWTDGHEISSLISRICKVIIDSNEKFDVPDFVSKFGRPDSVIENLRQSYFWKLMNLQRENRHEEMVTAFDYYAENYSVLGPSHWHSEILNIANRFLAGDNGNHLISFAMKWDNLGNLRSEDWQRGKNENGQEYPSLAVKTAKNCFDILKANPKNMMPDGALLWLKGLYEKVKQNNPEDDWSVRNFATICVWCGEAEEAISLYKSLLLHMGEKYYLWSELAGLLKENNTLRIGLLLKAKNLEKNEDFLGDIHLELSSLWIIEGFRAKAEKELNMYLRHRKEKGWNVTDRYRELQALLDSCENKDENVTINDYISEAEDFVYDKFEWVDYVLTEKWVNDGIEHCNLYADKEMHFSVKTKRFPLLRNTKNGDVVQFRCNSIKETKRDPKAALWMNKTITETHVVPLVARKSDKKAWSILPVKYGIIEYVNESKYIHHILTQDSKQVFCKYKGTPFTIDSFVKYREYEDMCKGELRTCAANVKFCSKDEALPNMRSRVVVVDDVNNAKKLFHVVLGRGKVSDIVKFDQTEIRPSVGDFLCVTYCIRKNKEGKKRIKFLDIQVTDEEDNALKNEVAGRLVVKYHDDFYGYGDPDFAFVNDYYVHSNILMKYHIKKDCDVVAKLVLSGDDKWKVYDLKL